MMKTMKLKGGLLWAVVAACLSLPFLGCGGEDPGEAGVVQGSNDAGPTNQQGPQVQFMPDGSTTDLHVISVRPPGSETCGAVCKRAGMACADQLVSSAYTGDMTRGPTEVAYGACLFALGCDVIPEPTWECDGSEGPEQLKFQSCGCRLGLGSKPLAQMRSHAIRPASWRLALRPGLRL